MSLMPAPNRQHLLHGRDAPQAQPVEPLQRLGHDLVVHGEHVGALGKADRVPDDVLGGADADDCVRGPVQPAPERNSKVLLSVHEARKHKTSRQKMRNSAGFSYGW